jgi:hypothetical protein
MAKHRMIFLLTVVLVTACTSEPSPQPAPQPSSPSRTQPFPESLVPRVTLPPQSQAKVGKQLYVALGDSYSSGEGAPTFVRGLSQGRIRTHRLFIDGTAKPDNHCHRSVEAYPVKLWKRLGDSWALDFHACSGSVIEDFHSDRNHSFRNEKGSQLGRLGSVDPALVTLSIGGNNAGFAGVMTTCALTKLPSQSCRAVWRERVNLSLDYLRSARAGIRYYTAPQAPPPPPSSPPVAQPPKPPPPPIQLPAGTDVYDDSPLVKLFLEIKQKAPGARILVVGYPRLFPARPPSGEWSGRTERCASRD